MQKEKIKILVVDDEPDILEILKLNLQSEGYKVSTAENGKKALKKADKINPDLIVLDLMMPIMDGIETCERLRLDSRYKNKLIIFLTARSEDYSQIAALDVGADDYITKPVKPRVFLSKIKSLLRRKLEPNDSILKYGNLSIDPEEYKVILSGKEIILPKKEFELLFLLASKPKKIFKREKIMSTVWGYDVVVGDRTIDVHIRKLREKIGEKYFKTIKGVGYKFVNWKMFLKEIFDRYKIPIILSLILSSLIIFFINIDIFLSFIGLDNLKNTLSFSYLLIIYFFLLVIVFTFILNFLIKKYISSKISNIYKEVSSIGIPLNVDDYKKDSKDLIKNVQKFADESNIKIKLLEQKENYRREFIGNIAHELKTPLFTVQSYILSIIDGVAKDKEEKIKFLNKASKGIERLESIVNDLDTITKIESGITSIELIEFDIKKSIVNIIEMLELQTKQREISLVFDSDLTIPYNVLADKKAINTVLTNLVTNSIKYGVKGGTIEIILNELPNSKLLVRVVDNGKGIGKKDIDRVFERFYRVDKTRSRDQGGSGLGLSIVKHIIEAHNEKIFVDSQLGIGSEFSFTLEKVI